MAVLIVLMLLCIKECNPMPDPHQRELMLKQDMAQQVGGRVELTAAELQLDSLLHRLKLKEMAASPFPPAYHFFKVRHIVQKSPVFKLLQKMPKGKKQLLVHLGNICPSDNKMKLSCPLQVLLFTSTALLW